VSKDGKTIYFGEGVKGTVQVMAVSVETGAVRPVTNVQGTVMGNGTRTPG